MNLVFEPITPAYAREIVSWRYDPPYDIYAHSQAAPEKAVAYLTADANKVFAVVRNGVIIGFRSFGTDGQVPGGTYTDGYLDTGGGLRPDLTGKGMGEAIIRKGLKFGSELYGTDRFRITVAAFNQRALKVGGRIGFREVQRFHRSTDNVAFVILVLKKEA